MQLTQNKNYHAQIELKGFIETIAPNTMVVQKLIDAGFTDVQVTGTGKYRYATGKWTKPTQKVQLPEQIKNVTEV
jgi:hypothetical protein